MYQLEVKRWLVQHRFLPAAGWVVHVDIDAMERAKGGVHRADKAARAEYAEAALKDMGVHIGGHPQLGRVDIVAEHPERGRFLVEVEGRSSKQPEQAKYSALGQLMLTMSDEVALGHILAVPEGPSWERQLLKVPQRIRMLLKLECLLVSEQGARLV